MSGSGWDYHELDLTNNARCDRNGGGCEIPIGFTIDFGEGPVDRLFISENGIVTFGAPLPEGDDGTRNPGQLGRSYIAPLYTDMISVADAEDDLGEIWQSQGRIDADEDPDLSNDTSPKSWAQGAKAFKVDWNGVTRPGAPAGVRCFIQIAIYDLPGNDFDLEFNYGLVEPTIMPVNGAEVGFRLGTNRYHYTGQAIDNRQNFRFEFRNGAWVNR